MKGRKLTKMKKILNMCKKVRSNVYCIYTLLFLVMFFAVYYLYIKQNRSFIWDSDGFNQYYIFLHYFNDAIRDFIHNPSVGFPFFEWNLGVGVDIIRNIFR